MYLEMQQTFQARSSGSRRPIASCSEWQLTSAPPNKAVYVRPQHHHNCKVGYTLTTKFLGSAVASRRSGIAAAAMRVVTTASRLTVGLRSQFDVSKGMGCLFICLKLGSQSLAPMSGSISRPSMWPEAPFHSPTPRLYPQSLCVSIEQSASGRAMHNSAMPCKNCTVRRSVLSVARTDAGLDVTSSQHAEQCHSAGWSGSTGSGEGVT